MRHHLYDRLRHRIQILVVLVAWFLATGCQWDIAQVVAWSNMFAGYSKDMTVTAAVQKTFSGEMCPICRAVQKGKQAQEHDGAKTPEAKTPGKLLDVCPLIATTRIAQPRVTALAFFAAVAPMFGQARATPPLPPPRATV